MDKHVTVLAAVFVAKGILNLGIAGVLFIILTGSGLISQDEHAIAVTSMVGLTLAALLTVLALPSIIAGYALFKRLEWGRILTLILAALNLFDIPFGTALGIYAFWVLLDDRCAAAFRTPVAPASPTS